MGAPFGCEGWEISHNCPCALVGRKVSQERRKARWIAQVRVVDRAIPIAVAAGPRPTAVARSN